MNSKIKMKPKVKISFQQPFLRATFHAFVSFALMGSLSLDPLLAFGDTTSTIAAETQNGQNGTQAQLDSAQAQMAKTTKTIETIKTALFGAAAVTTGALYVSSLYPPVGPGIARICTATGQIATFAGMGADIASGIVNKDVMGSVQSIGMSVVPGLLTGNLLQGGIFGSGVSSVSGAAAGQKMTSQAAKTTANNSAAQSAAKKACLKTFILMTFNTAMSANSMKVAQAAEDLGNQQAAGNINAQQKTLSFTGGSGSAPSSTSSSGGVPNTVTANASCTGLSNTECVKKDPTALAMISAADVAGPLSAALGQPLDQYLNGYTGQSAEDAIKSAAAAMGVDPASAGALVATGNKALVESGLMDQYSPMGYTSGSKTASTGEVDFNKMMSEVMKNLNPEDSKDEGKKDPSELVFRRLELLPPEKITENKDISLFVRIGYRYRKDLDKLEPLNWSKPENQAATSGTTPTRSVASEK